VLGGRQCTRSRCARRRDRRGRRQRGRHLAAVAALQLRGSGIAIAHQLLLYPVVDCATEHPSYESLGVALIREFPPDRLSFVFLKYSLRFVF